MKKIIDWLLDGDVSIQYQTKRDILDCNKKEVLLLQKRISEKGWGKSFLDKRDNETGLWGKGIYSPKWISTHYTLLDLKNINIYPTNSKYIKSSKILLNNLWFNMGKIREDSYLDVCIAGMILSICCYAKVKSKKIFEIIDYLLKRQYLDGGWNCRWEKGDMHSSVHTTINVLEGIRDYIKNNYKYRVEELSKRVRDSHEFLFKHRLFKSHRTGEIMKKQMTMLSFPGRWRYDILRSLDYFQSVDQKFDKRMNDAIEILIKKKRKNNRWSLQQKYPGLSHFDMEQSGEDSRWNTLRALRVLKEYKKNFYNHII